MSYQSDAEVAEEIKTTLEIIEQGPDGIRPGLLEENEIYSRDWYLRHLFFLLGKFVILIGATNFGENPSLAIPGFMDNTNEAETGFNIDEYPEFFSEIQVNVIRQLINENNDLAQAGFSLNQSTYGQAGGKRKRRKRRRKQKTKRKTRRRRRKKRQTRTRRRKRK